MKNRRSPIPVGAHLSTPRTGYTHHGVYLGRGSVAHYGGLSENVRSGPIAVISLEDFCMGRGHAVIDHPDRKYDKEAVVKRILSRVGEDKYHVANNNCEHLVYWAIEDYHHSPQVTRMAPVAAGGSATVAGIAARSVVSATGSIVGLSASGTMSGLATIGGTVGAGAVGGLGILGGAGGLAAASLVNNTLLKDDASLNNNERSSRSMGRKASYAGAAAGTAGSIAAVAAVGVPGLSAVGITTGLATIGSAVGGGMAAGVVITTAAPVAAAVALGYGFYKVVQWCKN